MGQFNADINQLLAELQLYSRCKFKPYLAIRQLSSLGNGSRTALDDCLSETIFKIITFFAGFTSKHIAKALSEGQQHKVLANRCEECYCNANAKRVEMVRREIVDSRPMFSKF